MKVDLKNLDQPALIEFVESLGQPAFRGRQLMSWLYRPGIKDFHEMTDLAKSFRKILSQKAYISFLNKDTFERSEDGSVKFIFRLEDGYVIEAVLIPEVDRNTLCVSSQVGCAMKCTFCLTGSMGFTRNLTPSEIVNQVCAVGDFLREELKERLIGPREVTNIVFMGMGEPLNNLENVLTSISILTEQKGLDFTGRRITVSTCGIVPKMRQLGENSAVNLAVSLHAIDDETRNELMPINRKYPVDELLEACRTYPMPKRRRIMFEYTLLEGINDSLEEAHKMARKLQQIPCKINLLPFNECEGLPYKSPGRQKLLAFQDILRKYHYSVFIRTSRGADIAAACGQLAKKGHTI